MVACGPRMKGSKPGSVLVYGKSLTSSAVYNGLTVMPSGVCQLRASTFPAGADLAADFCQSANVAGLKSADGVAEGLDMSVMA